MNYRFLILKHKFTVEEVERERFEKARLRNVLRLRNLISAESVEIVNNTILILKYKVSRRS